jgi:TolA-binding protein
MKENGTYLLKRAARLGAMAAAVALLGGCNSFPTQSDSTEGIGYRDARYEAMSAVRDYRSCRGEALTLDKQARQSGSAGQYHQSATLLEKCEAQLGPGLVEISTDERMHAYALSIQNYLKAGDVEKARQSFRKFNAQFPEQDLYFADGTSYKETFRALLGPVSASEYGRYSLLNANPALKAEMRRVNHWKQQ